MKPKLEVALFNLKTYTARLTADALRAGATSTQVLDSIGAAVDKAAQEIQAERKAEHLRIAAQILNPKKRRAA